MVEHIDYALVEKTRPMMYKLMKYWGKKPHNIFRTYIEHYSKEGEIVLDAFAGSGVCPLESIQVNRKAVAVDLNPISTYIIRMLAIPLNIKKFKQEWLNLSSDLSKFEKESRLFIAKCPKCKKEARIINVHYDEEITLDKTRNFDYYDRMLWRSFSEIFKVLKPNKYMSVTFHNSSPKIFNSIVKSCVLPGFVLEKILFQQNRRASESGVANPWGTAISDFYLRFRKPTKEEKKKEGLNRGNFEKMVVESAKAIIARRGQPTEITHLITGIYAELYKYGQYLETSEEEIVSLLKRRLGKEFGLVPADPDNPRKGARWWLTQQELKKYKLEVPLSDRVEKAIIQAFHSKIKLSFDDILQELFVKFPNALTPDYNDIKTLIKEYGKKTADGRWILNPTYKLFENKHIEIIRYLAEIGKKFGYKVWCPDKNQDQRLKEICENDLPFSFKGKERVKKIDALWFDDKIIHYAFEVENSTRITSALERGSNLPDRQNTKKMILIPKERARLLNRKVKEPMFRDAFILDKWQVAFYQELEKLSRKRKLTEEIFNQIFSARIKSKEEVQSKLS